jgi:hypothetical protein
VPSVWNLWTTPVAFPSAFSLPGMIMYLPDLPFHVFSVAVSDWHLAMTWSNTNCAFAEHLYIFVSPKLALL